jgi:hypothetical protein
LLNASRRPPSFPFASAHMHRQPISHDKTVSPLPNTLTNTWAAGTAPLGRVKIPPPTEHEQALPRREEEQEDGGPASGERTPPLRTSRESMVPYNGPCHEPSTLDGYLPTCPKPSNPRSYSPRSPLLAQAEAARRQGRGAAIQRASSQLTAKPRDRERDNNESRARRPSTATCNGHHSPPKRKQPDGKYCRRN